jgi:hypothetical protein
MSFNNKNTQLSIQETEILTGQNHPLQAPTSESIAALLNSLFPEQQYDKEFFQIKSILGDLVNTMTVDEVHTLVNEIRFLVDEWLNMYEQENYEGKTLKEILNIG